LHLRPRELARPIALDRLVLQLSKRQARFVRERTNRDDAKFGIDLDRQNGVAPSRPQIRRLGPWMYLALACTHEASAELAAGGDPSIDEPASVRAGGTDLTLASAVGAIAAGGYWYGDGDTLGYNTVYVKLADSADPDGKAADYVTYFVDVPINVPEHIRQYLLFKVGDAYENRESYTTEERRPAVDFLDNLINSERLYGM